jgi:light-regulated signal transduction histidine kinase (bacteriophytochrome)
MSTAVAKSTASASRPLPEWVQRIQTHYQQLKQQYQKISEGEDMEMIDSVQARVSRLDQAVQHLINCCNSEKEVIEIEFDDVRRDCEIFAQPVETNRIRGTQILQRHEEQIWILDFVLNEQGLE